MAAACSVGSFSISRITSRVSLPPAPITTGTRLLTTSMVKRAILTFSSRDNVGVSPVVPRVTIYSTPPLMTCSITRASAGSSISIFELKGVTSATPVPDKREIRLLMAHGYGFVDYGFLYSIMVYDCLFRQFIPESHFIEFFYAVVDALFR